MALTGTHSTGDAGHVSDHNAIDQQIAAFTTSINTLNGLTSNGVVNTTAAQTVAGIKTFSSSPIIPTPTASNQAATKAYVDGLVGNYTQGTNGKWILSLAPYNVDFTGNTDNTTQFQQALTDIKNAGGGELILNPGTVKVSGNLNIYSNTTISGCGMRATKIFLANNSNHAVLQNFVSPDTTQANGQFIRIRDLTVDGNKSNNTSGTGNYGIVLNQNPAYAQTTGDSDFDPHNGISNVLIYNCHNDGVHASARSELRLFNVYAFKNDGHGIYGSFDTFAISVTSCWSGLNGFYWQDSSVRAVNCKAFYNGQITVDGTNGNGFGLNNAQGGLNIVNCEAQDNAGSGFALNTCMRATLTSCVADSNSQPHINSNTSAGAYPGFDLFASTDNQIIGCVSYERNAYGSAAQQNAIRLTSGSVRNKIVLSHSAPSFISGAVVGAPIATTSTSVAGNDIEINVNKGVQLQGYSASITPDYYAGGTVIVSALSGNIVVNNPAYFHAGMRVTIMFKQDATGGRTVSWGNGYSLNGWTVNSASGASSSVTFVHDGTTFQALR